mmetsp:Transcript_7239/g.6513  ORF Transcript_7239/g.6513 Transcript_7239/m.6513 type:complete len:123 (+) Transcript_7239:3313-3681(+)
MASKIVSIVMIPTRGLVLKDFALEPDEKKFLKGASLMIQSIALNLSSLVTKDPFRDSFAFTLNEALSGEDKLDLNAKKNIAQNSLIQFTPLGISLLQRIIVEKALIDLQRDPDIIIAIEKRR